MNGENAQEVYPFIKASDFVMSNVDAVVRPVLIQTTLTKLTDKAFAVLQYRDNISSWVVLKCFSEETFCTTRTPGYLQLELTSTRFRRGETKADDAKAVHTYIEETILTAFIEGLPATICGVIKAKKHNTIEDAMKVYHGGKRNLSVQKGNATVIK